MRIFILSTLSLFLLINFKSNCQEIIGDDNYGTFTISEPGWHRVGKWPNKYDRGAVRIVLSLNGGKYRPQSLVIDAFKDWGSGLQISAKVIAPSYYDHVRITEVEGTYYIEIYATRPIESNARTYLYDIEGYTRGFEAITGPLPIGGGNVLKTINDLKPGLHLDDYLTIERDLIVHNKINAKEVKVTANPEDVPDYVFESDYPLLPIDSLKAYIDQHQHLPEIPNAEQLGREGMDVGEMNLKLLKKVEELSLYLIEQNEIIKSMNEKLDKQEQEIQNLKKDKP